MFNKLEDAINWIVVQQKFRPKTSLIHVKKAFDMLSLDLSHIKKVHVTGTNGKGSTCMYLTKIFVDQGLKVGTFMSPYLVSFNERIKVNGENISDDLLLKHINLIYLVAAKYKDETKETLSFFELLTLTSLSVFHELNLDIIVMEVGIGGLLDATNILNYDASVITNIGYDHMKTLGNTLEEIGLNKLGIVKEHNHLFTTVDKSLYDLFNNYVKDKNAEIMIIKEEDIKILSNLPNIIEYKNETYELSLLGTYQSKNAALAIEVAKFILPEITHESLNQSLSLVSYGGRLEKVLDGVYIDGAHNTHAMKELINTLHSTFKMYNINILFSALSDKEPIKMLEMLEGHVKSITTTAFPDTRYESLASLPFKFEENPKIALENLIKNKSEQDLVIITGSLHFIGYIKKEIIPYLK
ncbi:bifunctional folylpolyglutamate synthase/dihydrofolate synthase [Acholeplasma hippikon]|uniref:tetrahydrofolate synthase n=1 Tax=Acholeplasma hippikon TaxID=264636 RepID=A0A449BIJ6_9MOLU|nr:Mur ligase family protein [Acholeplasma hippikon]VEU82286.1 Folylpolyglutamate synthase [Acholeplasma hippikon]